MLCVNVLNLYTYEVEFSVIPWFIFHIVVLMPSKYNMVYAAYTYTMT